VQVPDPVDGGFVASLAHMAMQAQSGAPVYTLPKTDIERRRVAPPRIIALAHHCNVASVRSFRRECRRITSPYNSRNETVGTTNVSIDAMASV
jgi:hypothetical protein